MRKYKPEFLGRVIPVNSQSGMTDFVHNKYESFSKIYDACKDNSESLKDITNLELISDNKTELKIRVAADDATIEAIANRIKDNSNIIAQGDIIIATS